MADQAFTRILRKVYAELFNFQQQSYGIDGLQQCLTNIQQFSDTVKRL